MKIHFSMSCPVCGVRFATQRSLRIGPEQLKTSTATRVRLAEDIRSESLDVFQQVEAEFGEHLISCKGKA